MNKLIAIDIVIIPPQEIYDWAVSINHELWNKWHEGYKFDETHLPHISLLMLFVDRDDLTSINGLINKIADKYSPIPLIASLMSGEVKYGENESFEYTALSLQPRDLLLKLHRTLLNELRDYNKFDGTDDSFFRNSNEKIREGSVNYTKEFLINHSDKNYDPHITIFAGKGTDKKEKKDFIADRLTICHLGDYNSCRKILAEWRLK
ncbi:hypothetical protein ACFL04_03140 [Patescibacteria group bacterium]